MFASVLASSLGLSMSRRNVPRWAIFSRVNQFLRDSRVRLFSGLREIIKLKQNLCIQTPYESKIRFQHYIKKKTSQRNQIKQKNEKIQNDSFFHPFLVKMTIILISETFNLCQKKICTLRFFISLRIVRQYDLLEQCIKYKITMRVNGSHLIIQFVISYFYEYYIKLFDYTDWKRLGPICVATIQVAITAWSCSVDVTGIPQRSFFLQPGRKLHNIG